MHLQAMRYFKTQIGTFLLLFTLLTSCSSTKKSGTNAELIQPKVQNEIAFIVLKISKDSLHDKSSVEFVRKIKSEGKIKDSNHSLSAYENYLTIELYDQNKAIKTTIIEHPLFKRIEYVYGNSFQSKSVELPSQEFFIRVQIQGESNQLRIYETLKNTDRRELATIKL